MKSTPLTALSGSSVTVTPRPGRGRELVAHRHVVLGRPQVLRRADPHVHAELGAHQQQRVGHVVAAVPDERKSDVVQRLWAVLGHGQDVGQHLRRVELVGRAR